MAPIDVQALGARIEQLRTLRAMSLGDLATAAGGMAKSYLAKLERGEVDNPGLRTLSGIARALGVTVADLLQPPEAESLSAGADSASDAALAQQLARVVANIPDELREFLKEMSALGSPVPADAVRSLALAQFRGRRPETRDDWRFLYHAIQRSVG